MKKLIIITAAAFLGAASGLWAQDPAISIQELTGTVEVQNISSAAWIPAAAGMRLEKTAKISRGFKSFAELAIGTR